MATSQKTKWGYRLYQSQPSYHGGSAYVHLHADIRPLGNSSQMSGFEITFQWQTDRDHVPRDPNNQNDHWYGFHAEVKGDSIPYFETATALVRRITKPFQDYGTPSPKALIDHLHSLKMPHVVYDPRFSEFVDAATALPPEFGCWSEDEARYGYDTHWSSVVARTEHEAQVLMFQELSGPGRYNMGPQEERLAKWLTAGKPMKRLDQAAPTLPDEEALLRYPFARPVEAAA